MPIDRISCDLFIKWTNYTANKMKELLHVMADSHIQNVERSHIQKSTYCMIPFIQGSKQAKLINDDKRQNSGYL